MSESPHPRNPVLSRPAFTGRVSSPLSRPHFPWTTYLHRPSSASPAPTGASANWDSASTVSNTSQTYTRNPSAIVPQYNEETNMRQWSFTAFEWTVRNVRELRDYVEGIETQNNTPEAPSFDESSDGKDGAVPAILKEAPVIGDGKFKLEIGRTSSAEDASATGPPPVATEVAQSIPLVNTLGSSASSAPTNPSTTLSLFLTSMQIDWNHGGYEVAATLMTGIKCSEDRPGERGARSEWVWEAWRDWVFCKGSEFWECTMPSLSSLLENPRISTTDSFVICIQVHSPVGPHFPQQPSAFYVPKDLLDGIEASLDNANTGDVQFICLERYDPAAHQPSNDPDNSYQSTFPLNLTARKRVIYAHSDILVRRCEYFATLIASSFAENNSGGGRVMHTIVVEEADFVTIYWLLKWIYADWLLFKDIDDPRAAVDGLGAGWSARWLTGGGGEWDWKTFSPKSGQFEDLDGEESTARSVASDSMSAGSMASAAGTPQARPPTKVINLGPPPASPRTSSRTSNTTLRGGTTVGRRSTTGTAPSSGTKNISVSIAPTSTRSVPSTSSSSSPSQTLPPQTASRTSPFPTTLYPLSSSQARLPPRGQSDPYPHPTPAPPAASALSIYQIAHRYAIPGLQLLAMEHMMTTITPKAAFPLLLASCFWDELHNLVQDYVINQWAEVSRSEEFDTCVLEVSAGEWGSEGGKTLTTLFRRLHSPNQLRLS